MNKCKSAKIFISLGVTNLLIVYNNKTKKGIIAWYQLAVKAFL